ncbi:membrane-spanning 4-domains subfamily A member 15-like [Hyperolius riggenbachi]|uniref:membrane-spanning 4-domains subfamily A member 15-like n=1 Tax=Hyperolius riggenbachi TaxID=752182 RepID=UPI0035A2DD4C
MSLSESESQPPNYETIYDNTPTTISSSDVPSETYLHDVSLPPPAYQDFSSTHTWNVPSDAPVWNMATTVPQNVDSSPPFFQAFLKGKPKVLGILVIVLAMVEIALGIALNFIAFSSTVTSAIPFWGAGIFILAGSLTIAAQMKPNICLVKVSLILNIIGSIVATVAFILNAIDFGIVSGNSNDNVSNDAIISNSNSNSDSNSNSLHFNYEDNDNEHHAHQHVHGRALSRTQQQQPDGAFAVLSLLLITNFLLLCMTFAISIFGCRSLRKSQAPQAYAIKKDLAIPMNPGAAPAYCIEMPPPPPPPYPVDEVKAIPPKF